MVAESGELIDLARSEAAIVNDSIDVSTAG
jgi:hypothetical protein